MELPDRKDYSKWVEVIDPETGEVSKVQVHNELGQEMPDPIPMAPPLGYEKPISMFDQMRAQIRAEHYRLRQLELEGLEETVEQANDFEVDEDVENMPSLYEERFDPVDFEVRNRLRQAEYRASIEAAVDKLPPQQKELLNGDSLRNEKPGSSRVDPGGNDPGDGGVGSTKSVSRAERGKGKERTGVGMSSKPSGEVQGVDEED